MPFAIEPSTEISHRCDFSILANARGYVDAVEVGVDLGKFARAFLDRWNGHWLMCVDPYAPYAEIPGDRTLDMMTAVQALMPYHGRFRFLRMSSREAAANLGLFIRPPGFVYIDGSHERDDVAADLAAWWDVLDPSGMMAGHDFDGDHPGVVEAVTGFARERELVVRLTHETTSPPSWYCYRSEPETLIRRLFSEGTGENPHYVTPT